MLLYANSRGLVHRASLNYGCSKSCVREECTCHLQRRIRNTVCQMSTTLIKDIKRRVFVESSSTNHSSMMLSRLRLDSNYEFPHFLGRFTRISPQTLLVSDVDYIRKVNARGSTYSRSDWYKGGRFVPNEDTLISMTDDSEHKALRHKMAPGVR